MMRIFLCVLCVTLPAQLSGQEADVHEKPVRGFNVKPGKEGETLLEIKLIKEADLHRFVEQFNEAFGGENKATVRTHENASTVMVTLPTEKSAAAQEVMRSMMASRGPLVAPTPRKDSASEFPQKPIRGINVKSSGEDESVVEITLQLGVDPYQFADRFRDALKAEKNYPYTAGIQNGTVILGFKNEYAEAVEEVLASMTPGDDLSKFMQALSGAPQEQTFRSEVFEIDNVNVGLLKESLQKLLAESLTTHARLQFEQDHLYFWGTPQEAEEIRKLLSNLRNAVSESSPEIAILELRHAEVFYLRLTLLEIFDGVSIVADTNTNSLVVTAPRSQLDKIKAVVMRLDRPAQRPTGSLEQALSPRVMHQMLQQWQAAINSSAALREDTGEYTKAYQQFESAARAALQEVQQRRGELGPDHPDLAMPVTKLREAVAQAFEARQDLHRAQVKRLERQLQIVNARVERRDALKEKIIDRRVHDLMTGEDLSWETSATGDAAESPSESSEQQTDSDGSGLIGPVRIEYVEGLKTFIPRGNRADVERVMDIIAELEKKAADSPSGTAPEIPENHEGEESPGPTTRQEATKEEPPAIETAPSPVE